MSQWKAMMKRMRLDNIKATAPNFFEASGGYDMIVPAYSDSTSNGLTRAIIDYLNFSGYWASRTNVQGQARVQDVPRFSLVTGKVEKTQKVTWTKSSTRKGTPDISAIVRGHAVKIEVKIGRDQMREDQLRERTRIENAGGLYLIATSFPQFHDWYQKTFGIPAEPDT